MLFDFEVTCNCILFYYVKKKEKAGKRPRKKQGKYRQKYEFQGSSGCLVGNQLDICPTIMLLRERALIPPAGLLFTCNILLGATYMGLLPQRPRPFIFRPSPFRPPLAWGEGVLSKRITYIIDTLTLPASRGKSCAGWPGGVWRGGEVQGHDQQDFSTFQNGT